MSNSHTLLICSMHSYVQRGNKLTRLRRNLFLRENEKMKWNFRVFFELLLIVVTTQAHAAQNKELFCNDYATKAVKQYELAKRNNLSGIVAPAWSSNKDNHFYWCMITPKEIADNESKKRQIYLGRHLSKSESKNYTATMIYNEKIQVSKAALLPVIPARSDDLVVSKGSNRDSTHYNSMVGKAHFISRQAIVSRKKLLQLKDSKSQVLNYMRHTAITPERKELLSELSARLNSIDKLMTSIHQTGNNSSINQSKLSNMKKQLTEEEEKLNKLEKKLDEIDDDAELVNIDLQNMLKKQQKTIQMMSEISKLLHDTATAVIRKMN